MRRLSKLMMSALSDTRKHQKGQDAGNGGWGTAPVAMLLSFMRTPHILFLVPLALMMGVSACGRDSVPASNEADQNQRNLTPAIETTENKSVASRSGGHEARATDQHMTPPPAFQGRWTGIKDRCTDVGAELELQITPKELIYHESVGTILRVTQQAADEVMIDAAFTGEGQSWSRQLKARLSSDGQTLTIANDGQSVIRKRCDASA